MTVKYKRFNLALSSSNIMAYMVGLISWWHYSYVSSGSWSSSTDLNCAHFLDYVFFFLVMQPNVIYNCLLEVSVDILSQVFVVIHINIHICIHKYSHTYTHIYTNNVWSTVYYSYHLVIAKYHKSYQQYFDISKNYIKLDIYCYKKKTK